jgi:hypothetical protein
LTFPFPSDFGWSGWTPLPIYFCDEILPKLIADGIPIPREVQNDCDPGDRTFIGNATVLQSLLLFGTW